MMNDLDYLDALYDFDLGFDDVLNCNLNEGDQRNEFSVNSEKKSTETTSDEIMNILLVNDCGKKQARSNKRCHSEISKERSSVRQATLSKTKASSYSPSSQINFSWIKENTARIIAEFDLIDELDKSDLITPEEKIKQLNIMCDDPAWSVRARLGK